MAVVAAAPCGCLSTDLRRFLASDNQAQGAASHQLLRKLLSICTGKSELSPRQPATAPQEEGEGEQPLPPPAATRRTLRPRRRPAGAPASSPVSFTQQQEAEAQQQRPGGLAKRARGHEELQPREQQRPAAAAQRLRPRRGQQPQAPAQQQRRRQEAGAAAQSAAQEVPPAGDAADAALCTDLLDIVRRESGVVLALALHAMHIWSHGSPERVQACLRQGIVPVLLQVLAAVLVESSPSTPTAAYAASMAVILLRTLTRSSEEGMAAFVGCGGAGALLRVLPALREDRALCLALYLLSDVTRRSGAALGQAVEAGGVPLVVACLRQPVGESTKFAALLINRWCLLAPLGGQFRGAGALDSLLCVLRRQHSAASAPAAQPEGAAARALLSEVSAYSLSALSILGQEDPQTIRELLLGCPDNLAAVTRAMTDYERSFQGTGFPHALLSSLVQGADGSALAAQVVARTELLPAWLSLRQIGWELVERAAQADVQAALACLPAEVQGDVAQSLALLLPHSRAFLAPLSHPDRLAALTHGTVGELLADSASPSPITGISSATLPATLPAPHCPALPAAAAAFAAAPAPAPQALGEQQQQQPAGRLPPSPYSSPAGVKSAGGEVESSRIVEGSPTTTPSSAAAAAGEAPLQRGVSIIPEAIVRLEAEAQEEQQAQQAQQDDQDGGNLGSARSGSGACRQQAPAPFSAALRRLLAAWVADEGEASAGPDSALGKRGREAAAAGGGGGGAAAQQTKRARVAFSREDVNVRRYDTLTFLVGGREFHAVGFVLEAHSPLLRSLLGTLGSLQEALPIPCVAGFDADRMYRLFGWAVEFCYTGAVERLAPEAALDLWSLAEFLQMDGLQRECEALLSKAGAGALLGERYALGLAYPSGARLRLAVAREVLQRLAVAQGPLAAAAAAAAPEGAGAAGAWEAAELGADVAALLAAHPLDLAADMAEALAAELHVLC